MKCGISDCLTPCAWIFSFQPVLYQSACGTAVPGGCAEMCDVSRALRALWLSHCVHNTSVSPRAHVWCHLHCMVFMVYMVYPYGIVTARSLEILLGPLACFRCLSDHINPQRNQFKIKLAPPSQCKGTEVLLFTTWIKTRRHCSCIREEILAKMKWKSLECQ